MTPFGDIGQQEEEYLPARELYRVRGAGGARGAAYTISRSHNFAVKSNGGMDPKGRGRQPEVLRVDHRGPEIHHSDHRPKEF